MKKQCNEIPEPYKNVMVTYKKTFYYGAYRSEERKEIVTKKGFYCTLFNHIAVPPNWKYFNGVLLPDGFGGDRVELKNVISWVYCNE